MKTEKELQELKEKFETLNKELEQLTDEEIEQIAGGLNTPNIRHVIFWLQKS